MSMDILGQVQNSIEDKKESDEKNELSSSTKDKIKALQDSIYDFEKSYSSLRDERSELEKLGVKFDDLRRSIKDYVDKLLY